MLQFWDYASKHSDLKTGPTKRPLIHASQYYRWWSRHYVNALVFDAGGSVLCPRPKITDRYVRTFNKKRSAEFKDGTRANTNRYRTAHGNFTNTDVGLLGCTALWTCRHTPTFCSSTTPPSSAPKDGGSKFLRNAGIYAMQPWRPTLTSLPPLELRIWSSGYFENSDVANMHAHRSRK
jgi:hypothetical protein